MKNLQVLLGMSLASFVFFAILGIGLNMSEILILFNIFKDISVSVGFIVMLYKVKENKINTSKIIGYSNLTIISAAIIFYIVEFVYNFVPVSSFVAPLLLMFFYSLIMLSIDAKVLRDLSELESLNSINIAYFGSLGSLGSLGNLKNLKSLKISEA